MRKCIWLAWGKPIFWHTGRAQPLLRYLYIEINPENAQVGPFFHTHVVI